MRKNTGRARFGPDLLRNRVGEGTLGLDLCYFSSFASSRRRPASPSILAELISPEATMIVAGNEDGGREKHFYVSHIEGVLISRISSNNGKPYEILDAKLFGPEIENGV